jgi:uncharacterized protein (TIGR03437 family)
MSVLALAGTARAASTLYAATGIGPFKSTDSGVTWKQLIVTSNDSSLPGVPKILAIVVDRGRAGTFAGATTVAAKPGNVIILWATGFGPTMPAAPLGVSVPGRGGYPTASSPTVTVNNTPAIVYGVALAPGSAGLYQIAIQVPHTLADGDWPIQAIIGGTLSPTAIVLSVAH